MKNWSTIMRKSFQRMAERLAVVVKSLMKVNPRENRQVGGDCGTNCHEGSPFAIDRRKGWKAGSVVPRNRWKGK
jgi:hypothetical protein